MILDYHLSSGELTLSNIFLWHHVLERTNQLRSYDFLFHHQAYRDSLFILRKVL